MLKNSQPFLKISFIFYFSYLDDSNKLSKGIGKFGRVPDEISYNILRINSNLRHKISGLFAKAPFFEAREAHRY